MAPSSTTLSAIPSCCTSAAAASGAVASWIVLRAQAASEKEFELSAAQPLTQPG